MYYSVDDRYRKLRVKACGLQMVVWIMQPEAQTTTWLHMAVSASVSEIANVIKGAIEVCWLYLYPLQFFSYD